MQQFNSLGLSLFEDGGEPVMGQLGFILNGRADSKFISHSGS